MKALSRQFLFHGKRTGQEQGQHLSMTKRYSVLLDTTPISNSLLSTNGNTNCLQKAKSTLNHFSRETEQHQFTAATKINITRRMGKDAKTRSFCNYELGKGENTMTGSSDNKDKKQRSGMYIRPLLYRQNQKLQNLRYFHSKPFPPSSSRLTS